MCLKKVNLINCHYAVRRLCIIIMKQDNYQHKIEFEINDKKVEENRKKTSERAKRNALIQCSGVIIG